MLRMIEETTPNFDESCVAQLTEVEQEAQEWELSTLRRIKEEEEERNEEEDDALFYEVATQQR